MFTITKKEKKEKKEETKKMTYCTDCCSIIEVEAEMGDWVKCPHCGLQFRFTKRVIRKR